MCKYKPHSLKQLLPKLTEQIQNRQNFWDLNYWLNLKNSTLTLLLGLKNQLRHYRKVCPIVAGKPMNVLFYKYLFIIHSLFVQMSNEVHIGSQSHYIEVAQGAIFMEQNMRFVHFWAGWQYWKKNFEPIMSNQVFFHVFVGKKNVNFFLKIL